MKGSLAQRLVVAGMAVICGTASCAQPPATDDDPGVGSPGPQVAMAAAADIEAFVDALADVQEPLLDREMALTLVALPLACIDRPHTPPRRTGYLHQTEHSINPNYEKELAFYGCYDWHSAVNSTWAIVAVLKQFPDVALSKLMREKLGNHLSKESIEGEVAYFRQEGNKTFERPYGWAWTMKLYAELRGWEDPDAEEWADNLAPLVTLFSEAIIEYLDDLSHPMRVGTHANTAFGLSMMLDYAEVAADEALRDAIRSNAERFFLEDVDCPLDYEPSGSDFLSPCLEEAKLMGRILERERFVPWFDRFLPAVYSHEFRALTVPVEVVEVENEEDISLQGAKSHLIGLALIRAEALVSIAASLPSGDPRILAYRRLAAFHAVRGLETMFDADYLGSHWIGTFAIRYLLSATALQDAVAGPT